jgi:hypothetical protein
MSLEKRRPIFGIFSLMAGMAVVASELRVRPSAVGPEIITDTGMLALYLSGMAIISGLIGIARRERWRSVSVLGVALPFFVVFIEGVIKGKFHL